MDLGVLVRELGGKLSGYATVVAGVLLLQQQLLELVLQLGGFLSFELQLSAYLATVLEMRVPRAVPFSFCAPAPPAGPYGGCSTG